jgi:heme-degrading monooxygenase HmoA
MPSATIAKLKVENFETWKSRYDGGEAMRRDFRVRGVSILRDATDPNLVTIVTRFDSLDDAKKMFTSDRWKEAVKAAGGPPTEVFFTELTDERTY